MLPLSSWLCAPVLRLAAVLARANPWHQPIQGRGTGLRAAPAPPPLAQAQHSRMSSQGRAGEQAPTGACMRVTPMWGRPKGQGLAVTQRGWLSHIVPHCSHRHRRCACCRRGSGLVMWGVGLAAGVAAVAALLAANPGHAATFKVSLILSLGRMGEGTGAGCALCTRRCPSPPPCSQCAQLHICTHVHSFMLIMHARNHSSRPITAPQKLRKHTCTTNTHFVSLSPCRRRSSRAPSGAAASWQPSRSFS